MVVLTAMAVKNASSSSSASSTPVFVNPEYMFIGELKQPCPPLRPPPSPPNEPPKLQPRRNRLRLPQTLPLRAPPPPPPPPPVYQNVDFTVDIEPIHVHIFNSDRNSTAVEHFDPRSSEGGFLLKRVNSLLKGNPNIITECQNDCDVSPACESMIENNSIIVKQASEESSVNTVDSASMVLLMSSQMQQGNCSSSDSSAATMIIRRSPELNERDLYLINRGSRLIGAKRQQKLKQQHHQSSLYTTSTCSSTCDSSSASTSAHSDRHLIIFDDDGNNNENEQLSDNYEDHIVVENEPTPPKLIITNNNSSIHLELTRCPITTISTSTLNNLKQEEQQDEKRETETQIKKYRSQSSRRSEPSFKSNGRDYVHSLSPIMTSSRASLLLNSGKHSSTQTPSSSNAFLISSPPKLTAPKLACILSDEDNREAQNHDDSSAWLRRLNKKNLIVENSLNDLDKFNKCIGSMLESLMNNANTLPRCHKKPSPTVSIDKLKEKTSQMAEEPYYAEPNELNDSIFNCKKLAYIDNKNYELVLPNNETKSMRQSRADSDRLSPMGSNSSLSSIVLMPPSPFRGGDELESTSSLPLSSLPPPPILPSTNSSLLPLPSIRKKLSNLVKSLPIGSSPCTKENTRADLTSKKLSVCKKVSFMINEEIKSSNSLAATSESEVKNSEFTISSPHRPPSPRRSPSSTASALAQQPSQTLDSTKTNVVINQTFSNTSYFVQTNQMNLKCLSSCSAASSSCSSSSTTSSISSSSSGYNSNHSETASHTNALVNQKINGNMSTGELDCFVKMSRDRLDRLKRKRELLPLQLLQHQPPQPLQSVEEACLFLSSSSSTSSSGSISRHSNASSQFSASLSPPASLSSCSNEAANSAETIIIKNLSAKIFCKSKTNSVMLTPSTPASLHFQNTSTLPRMTKL
jgi:hypothetical protein